MIATDGACDSRQYSILGSTPEVSLSCLIHRSCTPFLASITNLVKPACHDFVVLTGDLSIDGVYKLSIILDFAEFFLPLSACGSTKAADSGYAMLNYVNNALFGELAYVHLPSQLED